MMPFRAIVKGQGVNPVKAERAKQLRRAATPEEQMLWQELRRLRACGLVFRRQQVIDGFIADFYCHAAGLVVELDGSHHQDRAEYDTERDHIIKVRNLTVLRFTNPELRNDLYFVVQKITAAAQATTSPPLLSGEGVGG